MSDERVQALAREILELPARELLALLRLLGELGDEAGGVREPRRPRPESPGDATVVLEPGTVVSDQGGWPSPSNLPEDYWESAG